MGRAIVMISLQFGWVKPEMSMSTYCVRDISQDEYLV
jgi:hypothetical protein